MADRERDVERLLTFVDAVVAIAITLLVLPLAEVGRHRSLRDTEAGPDHVRATATTAAFLLALAISVVFPATSYWPLLLLVLVDPVVDRVRAGRARAQP